MGAWMSMPHELLAGAFGDAPSKRDQFEVKRSPEEQAKYEKMMKDRGESLLDRKKKGEFSEEELKKVRKKAMATDPTANLWGASSQEQEKGVAAKGAVAAPRKAFDPENDLIVRKPITGADFSKLVQDSSSGLAGRFGRGNFATSFL